MLLLRRADVPEFWQSVTGSRDHEDEPLAITAAREVMEETGIAGGQPGSATDPLRDWQLTNVYEIYPGWRARYAPGITHNTEHLFGLCLPERVDAVLRPREHDAWRWLPWREAADACYSPSNAEAILMLPKFTQ